LKSNSFLFAIIDEINKIISSKKDRIFNNILIDHKIFYKIYYNKFWSGHLFLLDANINNSIFRSQKYFEIKRTRLRYKILRRGFYNIKIDKIMVYILDKM
jgi:hypothetical protein